MEGKICYQSIGTLLKALSALLGEDHLLPDKSIIKQAVEFVIHKKGVDIVISLDDNHILPHNKIWEIFARKDFIPYFLQKKETASSYLFLLINSPHTLEESTLGSHSQDQSRYKHHHKRRILAELYTLCSFHSASLE